MLEKLNNHINAKLHFLRESNLLLAISGGVDSVVLAYLCKELGLNFTMAHCNFKLRGIESDEDEQFVNALAKELSVEVFIQEFDTLAYAKTNKLSTQMAARELRYEWFNELSLQLEFDYILTAHHADDNLETFLINLSRGTGLDGLTGIPEVNDTVVRPLLPFSREEILAYTKKVGLSWREDSSNDSVKYLRNKIRHEVLPVLKGINPHLLQNFEKTISHLKESQEIINDRIDDVSDEIISVNNNSIEFNIKKINSLNNPKAYLYELLKDYGFTEWDDIVDLLNAQSGKQVNSEQWRLIKNREVLILIEKNEEEFESIKIENDQIIIKLKTSTLLIEKVDEMENTTSNSIYVDADKIQFPLIVRKKEEGDSFVPFGMKGKKKLSKFFKDEKLSTIDKENVLILSSKDDIIWVIGYRADDRFKVENSTKSILKITVQ